MSREPKPPITPDRPRAGTRLSALLNYPATVAETPPTSGTDPGVRWLLRVARSTARGRET